MNLLRQNNLIGTLNDYAIKQKKKILGVCLGMQLFMSKSFEMGEHDGLNFIEPLKRLGPAIDNIEDIIPEIQDLDANEWNELITFVSENWNLDTIDAEDDISVRIEDGLNAGIELIRMTQIFKA